MKRFASLLAAASLTVGLLVAGPPAFAAGECPDRGNPISSHGVSEHAIALGPRETREVQVGLSGWGGCFELFPPKVALITPKRRVPIDLVRTEDGTGYVSLSGSFTVDASMLSNDEAGEWNVDYDTGGRTGRADVLYVRHATKLSFNAGPEPVRHHKITFKGTLRVADWQRGAYRGSRGQDVQIYSLDPSSTLLATVKTRRHGRYRHKQTFPGTNRYQAYYPGIHPDWDSPTVQPVFSRIDAVAARR